MEERPNIFLFIFIIIAALGVLHAIGGFDDASVRSFDNHYLLP
jgi:hypothetical protein